MGEAGPGSAKKDAWDGVRKAGWSALELTAAVLKALTVDNGEERFLNFFNWTIVVFVFRNQERKNFASVGVGVF